LFFQNDFKILGNSSVRTPPLFPS